MNESQNIDTEKLKIQLEDVYKKFLHKIPTDATLEEIKKQMIDVTLKFFPYEYEFDITFDVKTYQLSFRTSRMIVKFGNITFGDFLSNYEIKL